MIPQNYMTQEKDSGCIIKGLDKYMKKSKERLILATSSSNDNISKNKQNTKIRKQKK